jgi:hypothetical protein
MSKKAPEPIFEVEFTGSGIYPEKIPLGTLARTLTAIQRIASGLEVEEEEAEETAENELESGEIRLLNVRRGSAVYRFAGESASVGLQRLRTAGIILHKPDELGDNDYMLGPLERISASAKSLDCEIIVRTPGKAGSVLAKIGPRSYEEIAKSIFVVGETSITGEVQRVGGATDVRCALRVAFQQRLLFCKVDNTETARKLGDCLYKPVTANGCARWVRGTWRIRSFTITSVNPFKQGSILDAFEALYDAGGNGWDGVENPEQYIEEVTGK